MAKFEKITLWEIQICLNDEMQRFYSKDCRYDLCIGLCFYVDFCERIYICIFSTPIKLGMDVFQVTKHNKEIFFAFPQDNFTKPKIVSQLGKKFNYQNVTLWLTFCTKLVPQPLSISNLNWIPSFLKNKIILRKHKEHFLVNLNLMIKSIKTSIKISIKDKNKNQI